MQNDNDIFTVFVGEVLDRQKFDSVMTKMVTTVKADEPGTVAYEWTVSSDGGRMVVYERYRDNEALMTHLEGFGSLAAEFMAAVKPVSLDIFGDVNDAVKATVADFAPGYHTKVGGFVR